MSDFGFTMPSGPLPGGDRAPGLNALQVVMIVLSTSAVILRFVARRMSAAGLWWDDWMTVVALILSLGINALNMIAATSLGLGKHIWTVPDEGHGYLKSLFALEVLYTTALATNKLAVLLMYQRLFRIERWFAIAVKVVAAIVVAWWTGVEVATLLQCEPVDKFWNYAKPGKCFEIVEFFEASAIPNVITDVIILLLPQPLLWKLKMSWSNKLALCGIFMLGTFTAISSIGRLVVIVEYKEGFDFTWDAFLAIVWYSLEPATGIICACLPCYGPLLRKLPGSPFGTQNRSYGASRTDLSRGTGVMMSKPRSRRLSLDTTSIADLTQIESSCKTSVYASASGSVDDIIPPGMHELNVIHVRNSNHITRPVSP